MEAIAAAEKTADAFKKPRLDNAGEDVCRKPCIGQPFLGEILSSFTGAR